MCSVRGGGEGEGGGNGGIHGEFWWGNPKERRHFEDLGRDGM